MPYSISQLPWGIGGVSYNNNDNNNDYYVGRP